MNINLVNWRLEIVMFLFICLFIQRLEAKEFIVGVEDVSYYPLFDFKSHRNTFSRELLDKFAQSKGYKFVYLPLPIKRFERWLLEEKIDFKYPDNARWYPEKSLKEKFTFSDSTIKLVAGTTVLKPFLKKEKLDFKALGTLLGFYPTTWIKQIERGQVALIEDASTTILIQQLLSQTVDGIDIEPSVIHHYLKKMGKSGNEVVIDKRYQYDVYDYHFSTIKYPKIINEFNQFLKINRSLVKEMIKKYRILDYRPYLK